MSGKPPAIGFFERCLTVWVLLCIAAGIVLGQIFPGFFQAIGRMEIATTFGPAALRFFCVFCHKKLQSCQLVVY